jgi:hypothetical protein
VSGYGEAVLFKECADRVVRTVFLVGCFGVGPNLLSWSVCIREKGRRGGEVPRD